MAPLNIVPTDLTDRTEAYGFIFLESTERIDAARHTTDGTEMIVCVAEGGVWAQPINVHYTNNRLYVHYTNNMRL